MASNSGVGDLLGLSSAPAPSNGGFSAFESSSASNDFGDFAAPSQPAHAAPIADFGAFSAAPAPAPVADFGAFSSAPTSAGGFGGYSSAPAMMPQPQAGFGGMGGGMPMGQPMGGMGMGMGMPQQQQPMGGMGGMGGMGMQQQPMGGGGMMGYGQPARCGYFLSQRTWMVFGICEHKLRACARSLLRGVVVSRVAVDWRTHARTSTHFKSGTENDCSCAHNLPPPSTVACCFLAV
jgi:hypothetical protein